MNILCPHRYTVPRSNSKSQCTFCGAWFAIVRENEPKPVQPATE
jgi:hypothetical protein